MPVMKRLKQYLKRRGDHWIITEEYLRFTKL